jgi:hypothetical protein
LTSPKVSAENIVILTAIPRKMDKNFPVFIKTLAPLKTRYDKTTKKENKKPQKPNSKIKNSRKARMK